MQRKERNKRKKGKKGKEKEIKKGKERGGIGRKRRMFRRASVVRDGKGGNGHRMDPPA